MFLFMYYIMMGIIQTYVGGYEAPSTIRAAVEERDRRVQC